MKALNYFDDVIKEISLLRFRGEIYSWSAWNRRKEKKSIYSVCVCVWVGGWVGVFCARERKVFVWTMFCVSAL